MVLQLCLLLLLLLCNDKSYKAPYTQCCVCCRTQHHHLQRLTCKRQCLICSRCYLWAKSKEDTVLSWYVACSCVLNMLLLPVPWFILWAFHISQTHVYHLSEMSSFLCCWTYWTTQTIPRHETPNPKPWHTCNTRVYSRMFYCVLSQGNAGWIWCYCVFTCFLCDMFTPI